ncbi:MAG: hypothetical protein Q8J69_09265 [Sphingobacteriaceae bacterium]|nr:hypothetical protein [Sphingobacteriaceae bacterium]
MKVRIIPVTVLLTASLMSFSQIANAQRVTDHYLKTMLVKSGDDDKMSYSTKDLVYNQNKDKTSFEMVAVKDLESGKKTLIIGKHHIPATQTINDQNADFEHGSMIGSKDEAKYHAARFPQISYQFITIDENEAKNLLEKVKQLRSNYIEGDTLRVKRETRFFQYHLNENFMVSMSLGQNGSSAKYFELWIGKRKEIINSDKFILYLTEFLAY